MYYIVSNFNKKFKIQYDKITKCLSNFIYYIVICYEMKQSTLQAKLLAMRS